MTQEFDWYVGIDWGSERHQLCLIDAVGQSRDEQPVEHTMEALQAYIIWMLTRTRAQPTRIAVAIETPRGAVVDTFLERGFAVFAINPKQLDRFRDRHSVAGAKDDRRDGWVLAHSLQTDRPAFRRLAVDDPLVIQLRELSRAEDDLKQQLRVLANRLRDQVYRVAPALVSVSPGADEPWLWALLERAPTPADQRAVSRRAIERLLKTHRIRRLTATEIQTALQAPAFPLAPGVVEAVRAHMDLLLPQLRVVAAQLGRCVRRTEDLLADLRDQPIAEAEPREHRDVEILESLPGVGRMVTVTMLAEASALLAQRDYHGLRTRIGTAPVTKASGKSRRVSMRRACNGRLRYAAYHWGRVSLQADGACRQYYTRLRARGHAHARALRSVVDRWLRILVAMLRQGTLYDATRLQDA
jgi:transposase